MQYYSPRATPFEKIPTKTIENVFFGTLRPCAGPPCAMSAYRYGEKFSMAQFDPPTTYQENRMIGGLIISVTETSTKSQK